MQIGKFVSVGKNLKSPSLLIKMVSLSQRILLCSIGLRLVSLLLLSLALLLSLGLTLSLSLSSFRSSCCSSRTLFGFDLLSFSFFRLGFL